jgi:hypothetical protein
MARIVHTRNDGHHRQVEGFVSSSRPTLGS